MPIIQETTPLLSDRQGLPVHSKRPRTHERLPISLRASRSAWPWLGQRGLLFVRGGILAYLTAVIPILVRNKVAESVAANLTPWNVLFDFSAIAHILQWLWHLVTFLWGLFRRHHSADDNGTAGQRWLTRVILDVPLAEQSESSSKHFYFSLLYTAAHVFNYMNTAIYWAVLVPQGQVNLPIDGSGGFFDGGWLRAFSIANMYGVTSVIASSEILFLNTIKHEHAVVSHAVSTMFLLAGYLGWAAIGNTMTGHYPFFWMDPSFMGSTGLVAAYASGFVAMGPAGFAVMYGLTSLREKLAGYASRPQEYSRIQDSDEDHERARQVGGRA